MIKQALKINRYYLLIIVLLSLISVPLSLISVPYLVKAQNSYPEPQDLFVNDYANIINEEDTTHIRELFSGFKNDTGIEATVLTINSINDYPTNDESIETFATNLFNTWGIGSADTHDGILILVAVKDREVRIEVGTAYESTLDKAMKAVIDDDIIPYFRENNYSKGIYQGSQAVVKKLKNRLSPNSKATSLIPRTTPTRVATKTPTKKATGVTTSQSSKTTYSNNSIYTDIGYLFLFGNCVLVLGAIGYGLWHYSRYNKQRCPNCKTDMTLLDEAADDVYLDSGQKLEEKLYTVNYHVWKCYTCNYHHIEAKHLLLLKYKRCPECHYRTLDTTHETLVSPSYSSLGKKQIKGICHHCNYQYQETVTLPKLEKVYYDNTSSKSRSWEDEDQDLFSRSSSSRSSSSRSSSSKSNNNKSFGGGSSSGGGASGKW